MGKNKKLKVYRKEAKRQVRAHLEKEKSEGETRLAEARQEAIDDTRRILNRQPPWLPDFVWRAMKRIMLRYYLPDPPPPPEPPDPEDPKGIFGKE